ncbi:MAG: tyrosine-type recombinase/integrase [Planctomycetes bacterium]|nr:tyrosine-type recombinase/integrase [Planctomycetota bacterium]
MADLESARAEWLKDERIDEEKAGDFLAKVNSESHRVDFHCLRHTFGAWLVLKGHPVNVVQKIMRHSTVVLTLETYGHLYPDAEADAVRTLEMTRPQAA